MACCRFSRWFPVVSVVLGCRLNRHRLSHLFHSFLFRRYLRRAEIRFTRIYRLPFSGDRRHLRRAGCFIR